MATIAEKGQRVATTWRGQRVRGRVVDTWIEGGRRMHIVRDEATGDLVLASGRVTRAADED